MEDLRRRLSRGSAIFSPRRFLRNGHLQTLAGNFFPASGRFPNLKSFWWK